MNLARHTFGSSGLSVAPLGIGSIGLTHGEDVVVEQMNRLLDAGANLVDTAACYPGSEDLIGRWLAHRRDEMVLVSKCGHHQVLADGSMRSLPVSMDDIDGALRRLCTDHLDAMLLHSYDFDLLVSGDAIDVLERAKAAGKVRLIGYSGDNERLAWAVRCPAIDVVETSINLVDQANARDVLSHAVERGVAVIAKRPLANAAWRHQGDPEAANPHHRTYARRFAHMGLAAEDFACASMGELALRFTISVQGVACAIASTTSPRHLAANLAAVQAGPLAPEHLAELRARFDLCERSSAGSWLGCN